MFIVHARISGVINNNKTTKFRVNKKHFEIQKSENK